MSTQFRTAVSNIKAMLYFKNEHHSSLGAKFAHDDAVCVHLKEAGFTEVSAELFPKTKKTKVLRAWAKNGDATELKRVFANMPFGSFIVQPGGSQCTPDILIRDWCGRFVGMELKSAKGCSPTYNDNTPKDHFLYVFCSEKVNATTIYMGRDVVTVEQNILISEYKAGLTKHTLEYKAKFDALNSRHKFKPGYRPKIEDSTNYFTHEDRETCETNALMYANE